MTIEQKEIIKLIKDLIDVGTGKFNHDYEGRCPDSVEGYNTRDRLCPACQVLIRAKKTLKEMRRAEK